MSATFLFRGVAFTAVLTTAISMFAAEGAGEPAPRFRAKTIEGESFDNDALKGKVVLLQFWTTWCQYCRGEQELVDEMDAEFRDKGLVVLAVNVGESKKTVKKYLEQNPRKCRIVLTEDTNLAARFEAKAYPVYVVIDREGSVAATQNGAGGEGALLDLLSRGGIESE